MPVTTRSMSKKVENIEPKVQTKPKKQTKSQKTEETYKLEMENDKIRYRIMSLNTTVTSLKLTIKYIQIKNKGHDEPIIEEYNKLVPELKWYVDYRLKNNVIPNELKACANNIFYTLCEIFNLLKEDFPEMHKRFITDFPIIKK